MYADFALLGASGSFLFFPDFLVPLDALEEDFLEDVTFLPFLD